MVGGNNTLILLVREPSKLSIFIHTGKRDPQTNLKDATVLGLSENTTSVSRAVICLLSD